MSYDLLMNPLARRERVRALSYWKAMAWLTGPLLFVVALIVGIDHAIDWLSDAGNWVGDLVDPLVNWINWPSWDWLGRVGDWLVDRIPEWLRDAAVWLYPRSTGFTDALAVGLGSGLLAWLLYSTIVKWLWDLTDKADKYKRPTPESPQ